MKVKEEVSGVVWSVALESWRRGRVTPPPGSSHWVCPKLLRKSCEIIITMVLFRHQHMYNLHAYDMCMIDRFLFAGHMTKDKEKKWKTGKGWERHRKRRKKKKEVSDVIYRKWDHVNKE